MADPFTAIGTAAAILDLRKAAYKSAEYAIRLYKQSKAIDETYNNLATESQALGRSCELVHDELSPVIKHQGSSQIGKPYYDGDGSLWRCIQMEVRNCRETLQELDVVLDEVGCSGKGVLQQASRQVRLDRRDERVKAARTRLQTHTQALHTVLLVVNMYVPDLHTGYETFGADNDAARLHI
jgi:hypothetical protein